MKGNGKIFFKWTPTQQQDFDQIQNKICTAPVLVSPNLDHPFDIDMDASDYSIGKMITHSGHPVAFHSETVNDTVRRYSMYENELYSIVKTLKQ